jgi:hypothetical protein
LVGVDGFPESGEGWGDLETIQKNFLLSLKENVLGPFDDSGQVSLGADSVSDLEVSGVGLEQGVSSDFLLWLSSAFFDLSSLFASTKEIRRIRLFKRLPFVLSSEFKKSKNQKIREI